MATMLELVQDRRDAIAKAETLITAAENAGRSLTASESADVDISTETARELSSRIEASQKKNTLLSMINANGYAQTLGSLPANAETAANATGKAKVLSSEYAAAFRNLLGSGGENKSAALYEGSGPAGGYAVPLQTADGFVPLAPPEMSIRKLATVIPTLSDIKVPRQTVFSTASAKAESGANINNFTESEPTIDSFTLSAFMAGVLQKISWELLQDVPLFQSLMTNDMMVAQQTLEEQFYVSGTGNGQPQGLLGNVGAGVSGALADANGHLLSIDALELLVGTLNAAYLDNASWLMNRTTAVGIRAAQRQQNLFDPVFTRANEQDFLLGFPVSYCASMPTVAAGSSPILFGDFRQGMLIGDRGGSAINVKILNENFAVAGQTGFIAFRRTDSRIRRPQAIQQLTLHA